MAAKHSTGSNFNKQLSQQATECDKPTTAETSRLLLKTCELSSLNNKIESCKEENDDCDEREGEGDEEEEEKEMEKENDEEDEEEDEDESPVIPAWPSRGDHNAQMMRRRLSGGKKAEPIQHKVYSLKDYSQVAGPASSVPINTNHQQPAKLVKSLSQERKTANLKGKRMSECFYPTLPPHPASPNLSEVNRETRSSRIGSHSMHPSVSGESRIERVRKLFVAPLSLSRSTASASSLGFKRTQATPLTSSRSGAAGTATVSSPPPASSSSQPRLSLQSGTGVLNKPHQQLLQAVYAAQRGTSNRKIPLNRPSSKPQKGTRKSFQVYGCPLQLANNIYPITCFGRPDVYKQQSVPYVLARLCIYIEENSSHLTHEGIFRVSGNVRLMDKLRTLFDHLGDAPLESESVDVATSASMLKMYLRELPEPLIPTRLNYYFITLAKKYSVFLSSSANNSFNSSSKQPQNDPPTTTNSGSCGESSSSSSSAQINERQRISFARDLTKLLRKLPIENYNLLKYLSCFLYRVSLKQQYNKMCAEALGIVFGPNVFRIRSESYKGLKEQELSNRIMASIISNYKSIFDSELTDPLGNLIDDVCPNDSSSIPNTTQQSAQIISSTNNHQTTCKATCEPIVSTSRSVTLPSNSSEHTSQILLSSGPSISKHQEDPSETRVSDKETQILDPHTVTSNDEDCEEGESYTPSTGSGSYCSFVDSESLESSYAERDVRDEDDLADDDIEDNNDDDDIEVPTTDLEDESEDEVSTSECRSETSYTPTSSHSLDDTEEEQPELMGTNGDNHSSCLVCARRESATGSIQAPQGKIFKVDSPVLTKLDQASSHSKILEEKALEENKIIQAATEVCDTTSSKIVVPSGIRRTSSRRRRPPSESNTRPIGQSNVEQRQQYPRQRSWSTSIAATSRTNRLCADQIPTMRRLNHFSSSRRSNRSRRDQTARAGPLLAPPHRKSEQPVLNRRSLRVSKVGVVSEPSRCSSSSGRSCLAGDEVSILALNSLMTGATHLLRNSSDGIGFNSSVETFMLRSFNSDMTLLQSSSYVTTAGDNSIKILRRLSNQTKLQTAREKSSVAMAESEEIYHRNLGSKSMPKETEKPKSEDFILVQMEATRALAQNLELLKRFGESNGYTSELEFFVRELVDPHSADPVHWLTCYVDHLTAAQTANQIEQQLLKVQELQQSNLESSTYPSSSLKPAAENLSSGEAEWTALNVLLSSRIKSLIQRYWDLKNIHDHNMKNHSHLNSFPANQSWRRRSHKKQQLSTTLANNRSFSAESLSAQPLDEVEIAELSQRLSAPECDDHNELVDQATDNPVASCWFGALCPVEFVCGIERRLAVRRRLANRQVCLGEMSSEQLAGEKLELQKNLLRYEHWFGRPARKIEASLVGHIYERYKTVKLLRQAVTNQEKPETK